MRDSETKSKDPYAQGLLGQRQGLKPKKLLKQEQIQNTVPRTMSKYEAGSKYQK